MKKLILITIILLIVCGCNNKSNILDIDKIMKENEYIIIDVRTKEEFEEEHVVGAINIPYNEITEDIDISKDLVVFVYCRSGNRSKQAYDSLTNLGYVTYDLGAISTINLPKE